MTKRDIKEVQEALRYVARELPQRLRFVEMSKTTKLLNCLGKKPFEQIQTNQQFELETVAQRMPKNVALATAILMRAQEMLAPYIKEMDTPYRVAFGVCNNIQGDVVWMGIKIDPSL